MGSVATYAWVGFVTEGGAASMAIFLGVAPGRSSSYTGSSAPSSVSAAPGSRSRPGRLPSTESHTSR